MSMQLQLLLINLPFFFPGADRARSSSARRCRYIIFSGLDASTPPPPEPPPPPAQHQVHWKPGTNNAKFKNLDPSSGLSRPDSSLESLAAIPVIHCSSFHFPVFAAAAVINGLICYFPVSAQGIRCSSIPPRHSETFRDIPTFLNTILLPG
jgi:hypothetical protein